MNANTIITIGNTLTLLYSLSNTVYINQNLFFTSLFRSYYDYRDKEESLDIDSQQPHISRLLNGKTRFPKFIYSYYFSKMPSGELLRADVYNFLFPFSMNADTMDRFLRVFSSFVKSRSNLSYKNLEYILAYGNDCDDVLKMTTELIYRTLVVTISASLQGPPTFP
jgi:hypothetical protein